MLKYLYCKEVFSEIPSEITLGVSISGCRLKCVGCHSRELWEDRGEPLTSQQVEVLLQQHKGITCLLLLGGEHDLDSLTELLMHAHSKIKTAWYSGLDMIPKDKIGILDYLDYVKLGHYDMELGGLDSPTTNQHLYQFSPYFDDVTTLGAGWRDITYQLQKNHGENTTAKGVDTMP